MLHSVHFLLIPILGQLVAGACNADNCLRALRATNIPGRPEEATSLCSTLTRQTIIPATALPTFAVEACKENNVGPLSYRISSACSCLQTFVPTITTPSPQATATGPCAQVSKSVAQQLATAPFQTLTVAAQLAHDCLKTVPIRKDNAIKLIDTLVPYVEWQSDLAFKKQPPTDYFFPAHDILGSLSLIKNGLQNDYYKSEYDFSLDLYQIFISGHDGHFIFLPDTLAAVFEFTRPKALVSISDDGIQLPKIKLYEDVVASPSTAPTVTEINGIEASKFIASLAFEYSSQQDPDAAYNAMFYEEAIYFMAFGETRGFFKEGGRGRFLYPGQNTTFTFDNGTSITLENVATMRDDFYGVYDGESYYERYCATISVQLNDDIRNQSFVESATYPFPVISDVNSEIAGFYLNETGITDVAVLSVIGFAPYYPDEFQYVAETFFTDAIKADKKKLVVDLSANGGGYILQGYDLFRQFFPSIVQLGLSRFRESDTFLNISRIFSDAIPADYDPKTASPLMIQMYQSWFNYRYDYNIVNEPFAAYEDKFAHENKQEDFFTSLLRWNLNDELTTSNYSWGLGIDITGYGNRTNFTQPFRKEDIIILTDGYCASTCSLFTDFMRAAGVKTVTMGGRPNQELMQAVGGVKGAQSLSFSAINRYARIARTQATAEQNKTLDSLTTYPLYRSLGNGINARDNILTPNIPDGIPSQFITEYADCRLFWTAPMITNVTKVWEAAAGVAFLGKPCAAGSLPKWEEGGSANLTAGTGASKRLAKRRERDSFSRPEGRENDELWGARHGRKVFL